MAIGTQLWNIAGILFVGTLFMAMGQLVDYFGANMNTMTAMGLTTQSGVTTFYWLTLIFRAAGILFIIAGMINVWIESKRNSNRVV